MPLSFDYDLLLVDETRDGTGTGISPNDVQVDGFYGAAVEPIACDFWDCNTQGLPLLSTLGMYKVVLWYADDFSQNLLANNMSLISGYILGGGKLLLSSWKTPSVFNSAFMNRFAGGASLIYDNAASLMSVYSTQYPNLYVDSNKTAASWNNMLPQIYSFNGAENSIYTATMAPGSQGANMSAGLRYTSTGTLVLLGFPLYYMQPEGVRGFLQQILPELISGSAGEDELVSMKPASLNSSPNPFNPSTSISYYNPVAGAVSINLYNLKGQKVRELLSTNLNPGAHTLVFDGLDATQQSLASGIYLLRFTYPSGEIAKKITLMK